MRSQAPFNAVDATSEDGPRPRRPVRRKVTFGSKLLDLSDPEPTPRVGFMRRLLGMPGQS